MKKVSPINMSLPHLIMTKERLRDQHLAQVGQWLWLSW